jgi:menaquinol-cytochrome c reductase iron-sulfur subunit
MSDENPTPDGAPRRNFIAAAGAVAFGALAGLAPMLAGVVTLLDPLRKRRSDAGMIRVANLAVLPQDGIPRKFTVQADKVDAWTTYQNTPVGAVYLRRTEEGVTALNVVCPHAGCFVGLTPDSSHFQCPCHRSSFALNGQINDPSSPAPRDMDELEVEVRNGDEIWVRFQNFLPGQEERIPV